MTGGASGFVTGDDSGDEEVGATDFVGAGDLEESGAGVTGLQESDRTNKSRTSTRQDKVIPFFI
jgi:hypothetical protein